MWKIASLNPPPPMLSCKFQFHYSMSFIFDAQFNGSTSETNAGLLDDNILEEFEGIDPVHLEEWMEAVDNTRPMWNLGVIMHFVCSLFNQSLPAKLQCLVNEPL